MIKSRITDLHEPDILNDNKNSSQISSPLVLSNFRVFLDFDNTITTCDVLDEIIKKFSVDKKWVELENAWLADEIGTKECLEGQIRGVRVTKKKLCEYLSTIKLDHSFHKLLTILQEHGVKPVILSDNFYFIIECILENYGIADVKVYANSIKFYKDRLIPSFPYDNPFCLFCAHCKKIHLAKDEHADKLIVYIGDGRSDICPALISDIIFAKDKLLEHLKKTEKDFIPYKNLEDIFNYFKGVVDGGKLHDKKNNKKIKGLPHLTNIISERWKDAIMKKS